MPTSTTKTKKGRGRGRPANDHLHGDTALLRAGQTAFARYGFQGASLRKIAAVAGVDPGLASHHFGSKEALWQAVIERLAETMHPAIEELQRLGLDTRRPIKARLGEAMRQLVILTCEEPDLGMFISQIGTEPGEKLDLLIERLLRPYHDAFKPLLVEAMKKKVIPKQPVEVMYVMLTYAVCMTVSYRHILESLGGPVRDSETLKKAITECMFATFLGETA
jgi:TetR/AcrR family transcriptional regulator